jgi:hypothetical protein
MEEFETIDIENNICRFQYIVEYGDITDPDKVCFKVYSIPENTWRWFSYTFRMIGHEVAKGEMMTYNGYLEFSKKGIPERIIEIASQVLKRKIISSPINPVLNSGDYLVIPSKKAWERLVDSNPNAFLNDEEGHFELRYIP